MNHVTFFVKELETWGYVAVFAVNFISALGIPAGSEPALIGGGALAGGAIAGKAHISLFPLIVIATAADILGACVGYGIGRYGGRPLIDSVGKYVLLSHGDLDRADAWFKKRGDPFALVGRLIPLLRSFVGIVAGVGEMAMAKFVLFTTIGAVIECVALCSLGYSLGSSWNHVLKDFSDVGYLLAVLLILGIAFVLFHRIREFRKQAQLSPPT